MWCYRRFLRRLRRLRRCFLRRFLGLVLGGCLVMDGRGVGLRLRARLTLRRVGLSFLRAVTRNSRV